MEEGTIIAAQILDGYYFYRVPVNADGCTFIESMGAIIFYELVYFIFLFHTKPIPLQKYTINRDVEICIFRQWKQRKLLSSVF